MVIKDLGDPAPPNFSKLNKSSHLYLGPGSVVTFVPAEYNLQKCLFPTRLKGKMLTCQWDHVCVLLAPLSYTWDDTLTTTGVLMEVGYRRLRADVSRN